MEGDDVSKASPSWWHKYKYLGLYSLLVMTLGCMETFHSALFVEMEAQLDTNTALISSMITAKSISFGISGILCAFILDFYDQTHRFVALIIFCSGISIAVIPWILSSIPMFIIFVVIGSSVGTAFVSFPVYIFRAYPNSQNRMMYTAMAIYGISKTVLPLIVQLSITLTGSYQYALYLVTFLAMITVLFLLVLPTPKHDANRTLKRDISNSSVVKDVSADTANVHLFADALKADKQHIVTQRVLILLLAVIMASFSATQSGLVNFIAVYCDQYLNIGESMGRFMISGYYGGQLLYRLLVAVVVGERLKPHWTPTRTLTAGFIGMNLFLILFVFFDQNVAVILTVYIGCGFISSGIFPDIFKWCELMAPVSGTLSCLFIGGFASGDALIVLIIGEIISGPFSVKILPFPNLYCSLFGTLLILGNIVLYREYRLHKEAVITKTQLKVQKIEKVNSLSITFDGACGETDTTNK